MSKDLFSINPNPTFPVTVKFPIAGEKTGSFEVVYKHKSSEEMDDLLERMKKMKDIDLLMEVIVSWKVAEEFNRENLEILMGNYMGFARAATNAYFREISGAGTGN